MSVSCYAITFTSTSYISLSLLGRFKLLYFFFFNEGFVFLWNVTTYQDWPWGSPVISESTVNEKSETLGRSVLSANPLLNNIYFPGFSYT